MVQSLIVILWRRPDAIVLGFAAGQMAYAIAWGIKMRSASGVKKGDEEGRMKFSLYMVILSYFVELVSLLNHYLYSTMDL